MKSRLLALLDEAEGRIRSGEVAAGFNRLVDGLSGLESEMGAATFRAEAVPACLAHPVRLLCHEEPITRHAYRRPRGYPGDADLIDLYYGLKGPGEDDTELGRELFRAVYGRPGGESVRYRRRLLAGHIDEVAGVIGPGTRVLSVASGHFREGAISDAVTSGRLAEVVCLDQDEESVGLVAREMAGYPVRTMVGSVRWLLTRGSDTLGQFDFVYAAGLYDYLSDSLARKLAARLFDRLRPGGRLLIANFVVGTSEGAYMAAFMNWDLNYRSELQVGGFAALIDPAQIDDANLSLDPGGNVAYLEVRKRP